MLSVWVCTPNERKVAIQALGEVADGGDQRRRIGSRAHLEIGSAARERNVNAGLNLAAQVIVFCVANHADNFPARGFGSASDRASTR